jgi:benzoylformate decarboxylase
MNLIFGNPGSTELPFLRDMPPDFQYVLGLHERTAIGMGLGYAMARGKAAFVNVHSVASIEILLRFHASWAQRSWHGFARD